MKEFVLLTGLQLKNIMRRKVWTIFIIIGCLTALLCYRGAYEEPYLALSQTAYGQAVLITLVLMMIGLETRREQRREHIDDIISAYSVNITLIPYAQIAAIGCISLITTVLIAAGCLGVMLADGAPLLWIKQSMLYIVLLYFLPCFILGLWGLIVSQWNDGKKVYLPALLVWLLTSSLSIYFSAPVILRFSVGRFIYNIINMGFNNFQMYENLLTGARIELPRWFLRIAVLLFLAFLFTAFYSKDSASTKSKIHTAKINTTVVALLGTLAISFLGIRYYTFFSRFADSTYTLSNVMDVSDQYIEGKPVSLTDFPTEKNITLVKTDIELSCKAQGIKVKVNMKATLDTDANGQSFVLYSGLELDKVNVDGKPAEYARSFDGIMIYFDTNKKAGDTVAFEFDYHGYSIPSFPANETTVQLNRAFPWIPWPGVKTTPAYGDSSYYLSEAFFIEDWQRGDDVEYSLKYDGPGNLYINLNESGSDYYIGKSDNGISVYSGMLHTEYRGIDVYVPASLYKDLQNTADAVADIYGQLKEMCEKLDTINIPEEPKSVIVIQVRTPIIAGIEYAPQELYSWGEDWEVRMRNEASVVLNNRRRVKSAEEYQTSSTVTLTEIIPYVLNPCTGFPVDIPNESVSAFASWMGVYMSIGEASDEDIGYYSEYLGSQTENQNEIKNIDELLDRMKRGENFDEAFKCLYNRLLHSEPVTMEDVIYQLYDYQGE